MVFLKLTNIKKSFNGKKVLNGIFLEIKKGERIMIKGPNGSGKTTLLKIIAGIIPPDEGRIEFFEKPQISFQFQDPIFLPWLNMEENLKLTAKDINMLEFLTEYFNLKEYLHLYPQELSGGYQQIFSFIRSFTIPHNLLILDEPFKSLDSKIKKKVEEFLKKYFEDKKISLLMVSHQEGIEEKNFFDRTFIIP
ncbi:MAG: ATP-binding cassette domain-containing protein [Dictyoglomaceae bacterium]